LARSCSSPPAHSSSCPCRSRRGYYIGLPIVMEFPYGEDGWSDDTAVSVSLSFGYSVD
jgi:hypothetical protein